MTGWEVMHAWSFHNFWTLVRLPFFEPRENPGHHSSTTKPNYPRPGTTIVWTCSPGLGAKLCSWGCAAATNASHFIFEG